MVVGLLNARYASCAACIDPRSYCEPIVMLLSASQNACGDALIG